MKSCLKSISYQNQAPNKLTAIILGRFNLSPICPISLNALISALSELFSCTKIVMVNIFYTMYPI